MGDCELIYEKYVSIQEASVSLTAPIGATTRHNVSKPILRSRVKQHPKTWAEFVGILKRIPINTQVTCYDDRSPNEVVFTKTNDIYYYTDRARPNLKINKKNATKQDLQQAINLIIQWQKKGYFQETQISPYTKPVEHSDPFDFSKRTGDLVKKGHDWLVNKLTPVK